MHLNLNHEKISYALLKKIDGDYETLISHNLNRFYHPASLLKLFIAFIFEQHFLKETHKNSKDLEQALFASIQDSDNDALAFMYDLIAPFPADYNSLCEPALEDLVLARKETNTFFQSLNFSPGLNLANKCFGFDYYGKEKQLLEKLGPNKITCQDLLNLLIMIESACPMTFKAMQRKLTLDKNSLNQVPSSIIDTQDYQIEAFIGKVLQKKLKLEEVYSKAAWTSKVRHDTVVFDYLASGEDDLCGAPKARYILAVMTEAYSHKPEILQAIAEFVLGEFFSK